MAKTIMKSRAEWPILVLWRYNQFLKTEIGNLISYQIWIINSCFKWFNHFKHPFIYYYFFNFKHPWCGFDTVLELNILDNKDQLHYCFTLKPNKFFIPSFILYILLKSTMFFYQAQYNRWLQCKFIWINWSKNNKGWNLWVKLKQTDASTAWYLHI